MRKVEENYNVFLPKQYHCFTRSVGFSDKFKFTCTYWLIENAKYEP